MALIYTGLILKIILQYYSGRLKIKYIEYLSSKDLLIKTKLITLCDYNVDRTNLVFTER